MITIWKQDNGLVQVSRFERNTWINVISPSQEEIEKLINYYRVPSEFITDILDIDERSRSEVEGRWLMIILRIPVHSQTNGLPFYTVPLGVLISHNLIVTICNNDNEVVRELLFNPKYRNLKLIDKANFVLQLFFCSATSFLRYLKDINRMTNQIEQDLLKSSRNKELHNLLKMEKCLVYFVTSLKSNELLLYKLQRSKLVNLDEIDEDLLEDVITENKQAIEMSNIYSDIQSGMMDAFASVVSNNLNVVMKQLTSITIILMIPTLVASIYGMNVPNFMEDNPYAFFIILIMSVAFTTLGVLIFRKRKFF
jgi:magnesium transporter